MTHSTLLTLLLATPCADAAGPLTQRLLPHLQQVTALLDAFRTQPPTPTPALHLQPRLPALPTAALDFERRLQELLRAVGLDLCDWAFHQLEAETPPPRVDFEGERYRRRGRSPNTVATLFGELRLERYLYEDVEPGNPCLFPLE